MLAGCSTPEQPDMQGAHSPLSWGAPGRTPGRFLTPRAIAAGEDGLFVVDKSGRIQLFDYDGTFKLFWNLPIVNRGYPTGLAITPDGNLAIADTHNFVVRIFTHDGKQIRQFGREGGGPGEFTYLTDVAFDRKGFMYVSEHGREDRIQKFDPQGKFVAAWGKSGLSPGEFHRPNALVCDDDSLYVADACNHRIQKFSLDGKLQSILGEPGEKPGQLLYPYDIALAPGGYIVVCEYGNNRIQVFDAGGRSVEILGGPGREPGKLAAPRGASFVKGRGIYVADTENQRIQLFKTRKQWALGGMWP